MVISHTKRYQLVQEGDKFMVTYQFSQFCPLKVEGVYKTLRGATKKFNRVSKWEA